MENDIWDEGQLGAVVLVGVLQNHRPPTGHRPPTHRQVLHRPTHHRPPTHLQVLHRHTDHPITESPTLLQLTNNPLTLQSYFNKVSIGPVPAITNFNSSFGMGTIYY